MLVFSEQIKYCIPCPQPLRPPQTSKQIKPKPTNLPKKKTNQPKTKTTNPKKNPNTKSHTWMQLRQMGVSHLYSLFLCPILTFQRTSSSVAFVFWELVYISEIS